MSLEKGLNQLWIDASIRPLQTFESLRQGNPATRRRLLEQSQGSDHREPTLRGRMPSGAIVHEHGRGADFTRKTNRFELAGVNIE
jgi:hypothetical protein